MNSEFDVQDVVARRGGGVGHQAAADHDVVERLAVAVEDVAVALRRRQVSISAVSPASFSFCTGDENWKSFRSPITATFAVESSAKMSLDEVGEQRRLLVPLHLGGQHRRLRVAEERLVATLRVEVVHDHEQLVTVVGELGRERLAARIPGAVRGCDAARARRELGAVRTGHDRDGSRRVATRAIDEREAAVGPVEEADADVAARRPAVLVRNRVDLPVAVGRPARRSDRGDETVERLGCVDDGTARAAGGAVVVLDLLEADDVRRREVVARSSRRARCTSASGSLPARFSTLNVAIETWPAPAATAVSRTETPVLAGTGCDRSWIRYSPKL